MALCGAGFSVKDIRTLNDSAWVNLFILNLNYKQIDLLVLGFTAIYITKLLLCGAGDISNVSKRRYDTKHFSAKNCKKLKKCVQYGVPRTSYKISSDKYLKRSQCSLDL